MSSSSAESPRVDEARARVARICAELLNDGACQIRVRIVVPDDEPIQAWFYSKTGNRWERTGHAASKGSLAVSLREVMQGLASHPPTNSWQVRHHSTADLEDVDLKFDREAVALHRGSNMRSWVTGALFDDVRATKQDRRRATKRAGKKALRRR